MNLILDLDPDPDFDPISNIDWIKHASLQAFWEVQPVFTQAVVHSQVNSFITSLFILAGPALCFYALLIYGALILQKYFFKEFFLNFLVTAKN
jgi:hypothetical protein